jgi:hypothetical protein
MTELNREIQDKNKSTVDTKKLSAEWPEKFQEKKTFQLKMDIIESTFLTIT